MHTNLIALLVLCATAISGAASNGVVNYNIPSFKTTTTVGVRVATNSSVVGFEPGRHDPEFDHSEGFLLLAPRVEIWRAGIDGKPPFRASFNTSFTVGGVKPIAFVLFDSIPFGSRDEGKAPLFASANVTGVAELQVGPVTPYFIDPDGLNVTVTPGGGGEVAVWIEYGAVAQSLSVYVGNGSHTKPSKPVVETTINLFVWPKQTSNQTEAYMGFYAGTIRDVINGVRDWNLTADTFPEESVASRNKGTSWLVILLSVLGSAATMSFV